MGKSGAKDMDPELNGPMRHSQDTSRRRGGGLALPECCVAVFYPRFAQVT